MIAILCQLDLLKVKFNKKEIKKKLLVNGRIGNIGRGFCIERSPLLDVNPRHVRLATCLKRRRYTYIIDKRRSNEQAKPNI